MYCLCYSSENVVRVFTKAPERAAEEAVQKAYEEEVAASSIPAQIGDINTEQLVGPEALLNAGKSLHILRHFQSASIY